MHGRHVIVKSAIKRCLHKYKCRGFTTTIQTTSYTQKQEGLIRKILWTDEAKINLYHNDGKTIVEKERETAHDPKHTILSVKHSGANAMYDCQWN